MFHILYQTTKRMVSFYHQNSTGLPGDMPNLTHAQKNLASHLSQTCFSHGLPQIGKQYHRPFSCSGQRPVSFSHAIATTTQRQTKSCCCYNHSPRLSTSHPLRCFHLWPSHHYTLNTYTAMTLTGSLFQCLPLCTLFSSE